MIRNSSGVGFYKLLQERKDAYSFTTDVWSDDTGEVKCGNCRHGAIY